MSQPEKIFSFDVKQTYDTDTGLVDYVVTLGDLHKVVDEMNEQAKRLKEENAVLTAKVEWLMKADRLVVWNGTEWEIRHVHNK